jgi:hypothetical protein
LHWIRPAGADQCSRWNRVANPDTEGPFSVWGLLLKVRTMTRQSNATSSRGRGFAAPINSPCAFHLPAKPNSAIRKQDCNYRFFSSKEILYPGSRFQMADGLRETYLRQRLADRNMRRRSTLHHSSNATDLARPRSGGASGRWRSAARKGMKFTNRRSWHHG